MIIFPFNKPLVLKSLQLYFVNGCLQSLYLSGEKVSGVQRCLQLFVNLLDDALLLFDDLLGYFFDGLDVVCVALLLVGDRACRGCLAHRIIK